MDGANAADERGMIWHGQFMVGEDGIAARYSTRSGLALEEARAISLGVYLIVFGGKAVSSVVSLLDTPFTYRGLEGPGICKGVHFGL